MQPMTLFAIGLIACLVSGCSITVPNIEVCRDKSSLGAHCAWTNSGPSRDIPIEEWQSYRFGNFCMSEEAFAKNQKFIEQACELTKGCDVEKLIKLQKRFLDALSY